MLRVYLLGELKILWNDRPLPSFSTQKANSLFGFLCLHPNQEFSREFLADILWSEVAVGNTLRGLDAAIDEIREVFENAGVPTDDYLKVNDYSIELHSQKNFWLDAIEFESAYHSSDLLVLQSAVQMYRGPLMETFNETWCLQERRRMEQYYLQALKSLITLDSKAAHYQKVVVQAEHYLKMDPGDEDVRAALMMALSGQGNVAGVVEHYEKYCVWLQHERQSEPGVELQNLVKQLTAGWQPAPLNQPTPPAFQRAPVSTQLQPVINAVEPSKDENIFVGRHDELQKMADWWRQGSAPVLCISGEQGCGKTRLIQEFAYQLQSRHAIVGWARSYSYAQGLPYPEMSDILRSLLAQAPASVRAKTPDALVRDILAFFPDLAFFFPARPKEAVNFRLPAVVAVAAGRPVDLPSELSAMPGLTAQTPVVIDPVYVSSAVTQLVLFLARFFPVLIVLDDAHNASASIQHVLEYMLANIDHRMTENRHMVKILLTGTPDRMIENRSGLCLLVSSWLREGKVEHIDLGNLNREDVRQWLFLWSGSPHKVNALAEKLYLQTGGNPYYLKETIYTLTYNGSLLTGMDGWEGTVLQGHDPQLPVPPAVRSQVENRLQRLSMLGLQVVQAAAVIGPLVPFPLLRDLIKRSGNDLLDAIHELLNAGLLAEFPDEEADEEIFRFPCLLYKQTIYEQTTQVRKSVLEKRMVQVAQEGLTGCGLL